MSCKYPVILVAMAVSSIIRAGNVPDSTSVRIYEDVPYAHAEGYWCDNPAHDNDVAAQVRMFPKVLRRRDLELTMDIYCPETSSGTASCRPLVMLIHGGAYYANSKRSEPVASLCRDLAARGYVTASINYRLGYHLTGASVRKARENAVDDASAALDFLLENGAGYGIDTSFVIVGGASSGAITALTLASRDDRVCGIIDLWGAVDRLDLLDSCNAGLLAIHGNVDTTVPYDEGYPLGGRLMGYMYGSRPLVARRLAQGHDARLVTLDGYGHAPYREKDFSFNENYPLMLNEILVFLGNSPKNDIFEK